MTQLSLFTSCCAIQVAAAAAEVMDAEAAAVKPLSKKEKKKRAKEAAANGQITGGPQDQSLKAEVSRRMVCELPGSGDVSLNKCNPS